MRDHNWAFSAWEISRLNNEILPGARLLHVDFHDDYCETGNRIDEIKTVEDAILAGGKLEIFDFIKAAESTGTIQDVYMIGDYDRHPSPNVIHSYTFYQFENEHRLKFFQPENQSMVLDLDLDFFNLHAHHSIGANYNKNSFLYSDEYIIKQLVSLKRYEESWNIITVCISPEYCGGNEAAQHLLDLFLEAFELSNEPYIEW